MESEAKNQFSKLGWTEEEEQELRRITQEVGENRWKIIADQLNKKFPEKRRNNKQCRERYIHYAQVPKFEDPQPAWSPSYVSKLLRLSVELKTKWSIISRELIYWPENFLKNKFNGFLHKLIRKIQNVCRLKHKSVSKSVRLNTLICLVHFPFDDPAYSQESCSTAKNVLQKIIDNAEDIESGIENFEALKEIEQGIHEFTKNNKGFLMNMGKRKINSKLPKVEPTVEDEGFHNVIVLKKAKERNSTDCVSRNNGSENTMKNSEKNDSSSGNLEIIYMPCQTLPKENSN